MPDSNEVFYFARISDLAHFAKMQGIEAADAGLTLDEKWDLVPIRLAGLEKGDPEVASLEAMRKAAKKKYPGSPEHDLFISLALGREGQEGLRFCTTEEALLAPEGSSLWWTLTPGFNAQLN